jgi:hypothetical protein
MKHGQRIPEKNWLKIREITVQKIRQLNLIPDIATRHMAL